MTPRQWAAQPRNFRETRTQRLVKFSRRWAQTEMRRQGLPISMENCRQIIDNGDLKWEIKVLECIGFDIDMYDRLHAEAGY